MAYASKAGRARTSSTNPEAHAICDRCGFRYNFNDLSWQFEWRGATLQNIRILVCMPCLDTPQEQLRAITLPADPTSIINARVEIYSQDSTDYMTLTPATVSYPQGIPVPNTTRMVTQTGKPMTRQPIGPNALPTSQGPLAAGIGLDPKAQMAFVIQSHWADPVPVLSLTANGTTIVTATCSAAHGLSTGAQIAVDGVANQASWGFWNITVTSPVAFTYEVNDALKAGSLLTGGTKVITTHVGVPWNFDGQVPKVGI